MFSGKIQLTGKFTLKAIRSMTGMTQEEFAKYVGLPVTSYRRYERDTKSMEFGRLVQLCDKLDIGVENIAM